MKEQFKQFVRDNPSLITYVNSKEKTWQEFYELYDLYGDDKNIWNKYLTKEKEEQKKEVIKESGAFTDLIAFLKTINLDSLQEGINSVQRVLGVFQDFSSKDAKIEEKKEYKPRPLYKHFED